MKVQKVIAPICGARTVDLGEPTSCILPHGHEGNHEDGAIGWTGDECPIELGGERYTTPRGARALIASLQAQLDALDPDAAIMAAERLMVEAFVHAEAMSRITTRTFRASAARNRAVRMAWSNADGLEADWFARIEAAHKAKDGGT